MRKLLTVVLLIMLAAPCLLIMSTGKDGSFTLFNAIGLGWLLCLILFGRKLLPKWARLEIEEMCME